MCSQSALNFVPYTLYRNTHSSSFHNFIGKMDITLYKDIPWFGILKMMDESNTSANNSSHSKSPGIWLTSFSSNHLVSFITPWMWAFSSWKKTLPSQKCFIARWTWSLRTKWLFWAIGDFLWSCERASKIPPAVNKNHQSPSPWGSSIQVLH